VQRCYLLLEGLRHRVLLSAVAVQAHKREEAIRLAVFELELKENQYLIYPRLEQPVQRISIRVR
jgi:hypothetical protein